MDVTLILKKLKVNDEGLVINAPELVTAEFQKVGFHNSYPSEKSKTILLFIRNRDELQRHFSTVKEHLIL